MKKTKTNQKKTELNLEKIARASIKIAIESGDLLLKFQKKISKLKITYKEAQGVASDADLASEKFIIKELKNILPDSNFLAEEDWHSKKLKNYEGVKNLEKCWVIDPLDGTHNFLNGSDYFSICISLVDCGVPLLGIVYRPSSKEIFYTFENKKSYYINAKGKKSSIKSNKFKKLNESLLVTGFATEKGEVFDKEFELFKNMMGHSRGIRRFGSAALDICYVALGAWDGFWERGLAPWDIAAAGLIAQNAGLIVTDYYGQPFDPYSASFVAASKTIHDQMIQHLKS